MTNSLTVVVKYFQIHQYFCCKNVGSFFNAKATHIFSVKNINVFARFHNRNFNFTLANNH